MVVVYISPRNFACCRMVDAVAVCISQRNLTYRKVVTVPDCISKRTLTCCRRVDTVAVCKFQRNLTCRMVDTVAICISQRN